MMPSPVLSEFLPDLTPPPPSSIHPLDKTTHVIAATTNDRQQVLAF